MAQHWCESTWGARMTVRPLTNIDIERCLTPFFREVRQKLAAVTGVML